MTGRVAPPGISDAREVLLAAGRGPLAAELSRSLSGRCGIAPESRMIVGCSGGGDSTALTVLLQALSLRRSSQVGFLLAVHVDHGLRPESAEEAR